MRPQSDEIGPPLFQVSHIVVFLALAATFFILCASVAKHPVAGLGYVGFCAMTALIYKYFLQI
jgi:hypothetical protein